MGMGEAGVTARSRRRFALLTAAGGGLIGLVIVLLEKAGNPRNMGLCVSCFERDIAGALGMHRAAAVQYLRPEIPAMLLGALLAALLFGEFRPRWGPAAVVRFFLGVFATVGALVFLGCSWRLLVRLSALDLNALTGLAGLVAGVSAAVFFERRGFHLGGTRPAPAFTGAILPAVMVLLLLVAVLGPAFGDAGVPFSSVKGPGSQHAPLLIALAGGAAIGFLAQRMRLCTVGAFRDSIAARDFRLLGAAGAIVAAAFGARLVLGGVDPGFAGQPISHAVHLWNFLGMALAGLAFALGGGCPGRQLVAAGEGSGDAAAFVGGCFAGAAFAHNLALAAAPAGPAGPGGPGPWGQAAVVAGLLFCVAAGLLLRRRAGEPAD
jgi:hypothetical protein